MNPGCGLYELYLQKAQREAPQSAARPAGTA